ncbi:MAG: hypothetical protein ACI932_000615, partial [Paracoccaceae bacterium]
AVQGSIKISNQMKTPPKMTGFPVAFDRLTQVELLRKTCR